MAYKDREQQRTYQRGWMQSRRDAYFAGQVCYFCGAELVRPVIHHLDPAQKESHHVWSWSARRREAELAKCVPACADCHAQYHASQRLQTEHGTAGMYKRGCHCAECRKWNRDRARLQRSEHITSSRNNIALFGREL